MTNYEFDLKGWLPRIPLVTRNFGTQRRYFGEKITSPFHLCQNEHLRQLLKDQIEWGEPIELDVFVMAQGEPPDRHVMKIGGMPYWPVGRPWPQNESEEPLVFLAQFYFGDSKDICGKLPGDVLLIFADCYENKLEGLDEIDPAELGLTSLEELDTKEIDFESLKFEWMPADIQRLISSDELPEQRFKITACYGYKCRTLSFPKATVDTALLSPHGNLKAADGLSVQDWERILRYEGTQIAATHTIFQNELDIPGRPLCTLASVKPVESECYPWVNQTQSTESSYRESYLMIQDMGSIFIAIDDSGKLHFEMQSY